MRNHIRVALARRNKLRRKRISLWPTRPGFGTEPTPNKSQTFAPAQEYTHIAADELVPFGKENYEPPSNRLFSPEAESRLMEQLEHFRRLDYKFPKDT